MRTVTLCVLRDKMRHLARGDTRNGYTSQPLSPGHRRASPCHHRASGPHCRRQTLRDRISGAMRKPASRERFVPN